MFINNKSALKSLLKVNKLNNSNNKISPNSFHNESFGPDMAMADI